MMAFYGLAMNKAILDAFEREHGTKRTNFRLMSLQAGVSPTYANLQNISYDYDDVGNVLTITDGRRMTVMRPRRRRRRASPTTRCTG